MIEQATSTMKNNASLRYLLFGVSFGLLFPLFSIALLLAQNKTALTLTGIAYIHSSQPLLWVIDSAPVFLGIFAYIAGVRQSQVMRLNWEMENRYEIRGLALNALEGERTQQQRRIERHLVQLNLAAQVAREAASIHDLAQLLNETARLISDQFGFYHVGIFIISPDGKFAVLRAANSEGGLKMLERGHQLEVGKTGIVGYAAANGEARIALDVGEDATYFDNPDLVETRSEMALPLKVRERVMGVLDVQSKQANAFNDEDVRILQTLADQIALAIDNVSLLSESNQALQELQGLYAQQTYKTWQQQVVGRKVAYQFRAHHVKPLEEPVPSAGSDDPSQVQIPINLRGIRLGRLVLKRDENAGPWTEEEKILLAQASEQVALALENARLYEEAQARAMREQTINALTASLSRSLDIETLLKAAVKQIGEVPGIWDVAVHIQSPQEPDNNLPAVPEELLDEKSNEVDRTPGNHHTSGNGHHPGNSQSFGPGSK